MVSIDLSVIEQKLSCLNKYVYSFAGISCDLNAKDVKTSLLRCIDTETSISSMMHINQKFSFLTYVCIGNTTTTKVVVKSANLDKSRVMVESDVKIQRGKSAVRGTSIVKPPKIIL